MSIISELESLFKYLDGRARSPAIEERLGHAAKLASQNKYEAKEIVEVLSSNMTPGDKWGPGISENFRVDYATMCVDWLSQLAGGTDWLFKLGNDEKYAWFVREEAFVCIAHFKPVDVSKEQWNKVIKLAIAGGTIGVEDEIRFAALKALVENQIQDSLPALQNLHDHPNKVSNCVDNSEEHALVEGTRTVMMACAALGSKPLIAYVIEHLFIDRWHIQERATRTMELISQRMGGPKNIARELLQQAKLDPQAIDLWDALKDHTNSAVVRWSLTCASHETIEQIKDLNGLLDNDDWGIRAEASKELAQVVPTIKESTKNLLQATFQDHNSSRLQRSWCAYVLTTLGQKIGLLFPLKQRESMNEIWRTPWPFESKIDPSIREAIVHAYGYPLQDPGTDVRYYLERQMIIEYTSDQTTADRQRLINALRSAGIEVTSSMDCGDYKQQGGGTFWVLGLGKEANSNELYVSELGKFACYVDACRAEGETHAHSSTKIAPEDKDIKDPAQLVEQKVCKKVATELGFVFPNQECLRQKIPGLKVYMFCRPEPAIEELLFYWNS